MISQRKAIEAELQDETLLIRATFCKHLVCMLGKVENVIELLYEFIRPTLKLTKTLLEVLLLAQKLVLDFHKYLRVNDPLRAIDHDVADLLLYASQLLLYGLALLFLTIQPLLCVVLEIGVQNSLKLCRQLDARKISHDLLLNHRVTMKFLLRTLQVSPVTAVVVHVALLVLGSDGRSTVSASHEAR